VKKVVFKNVLVFTSLFFLIFSSCKKNNTPSQIITPVDTFNFAKGADASWITEMEYDGQKFYTSSGTQQECLSLLKSKGINSIRLRAWVNPTAGWCNTSDLVTKAVRAKNLGLRIMIDFHYSDWWADPSKQNKPAAWTAFGFTDLKMALAAYTTHVLDTLKSNDITPDWVQVGNETGDGMLWEDGRASTNMANYAVLNNAGYDANKFQYDMALTNCNNATTEYNQARSLASEGLTYANSSNDTVYTTYMQFVLDEIDAKINATNELKTAIPFLIDNDTVNANNHIANANAFMSKSTDFNNQREDIIIRTACNTGDQNACQANREGKFWLKAGANFRNRVWVLIHKYCPNHPKIIVKRYHHI